MAEAKLDIVIDLEFVIERMQLDPTDTVVIMSEKPIDDEALDEIQCRAKALLPGHRIIVVDCGMRIAAVGHDAGLQRIEEKLDRLIEALAEDGIEPPARTLDGDLFPNAERDQTQSL